MPHRVAITSAFFLSATAQNSAQNRRNNQRKLSTASAGHHIKESWLL
jgi:hypothetical protein